MIQFFIVPKRVPIENITAKVEISGRYLPLDVENMIHHDTAKVLENLVYIVYFQIYSSTRNRVIKITKIKLLYDMKNKPSKMTLCI